MINLLKQRFAAALSAVVGGMIAGSADDAESLLTNLLDTIRPVNDPKFGDYQANLAMPLAKKLSKPPREVAQQIIGHLQISDICETPEIAGPGFINLRLKETCITEMLQKAAQDTDRLGVPSVDESKKKTYIVDYSGPNVAKAMHVGHLRSTVIGNALVRMLRFQGHRVISDNHLGDWGTQFGMIIYGYKNYLDKEAYQQSPVEELNRIYRLVRQKVDEPDEAAAAAVLSETAKLHSGDETNLKIWREVLPYATDEIDKIYQRLNISFDYTLGESFYHPMLAGIVDDLLKQKIARETDGAAGIFFDGDDVPMLIRKKDGAFLYGTTDLAAMKYRMETFRPDVILILTDFRQSLHFEHLFKAVRMMGIGNVELKHIKFGTVLGEDGKAFKTRSGDTVGLNGLLDEAVKAAESLASKDADTAISAQKIGIGAVIYADLSQNRESDYVFSYEKMLAMNGNTAAYLQYAYARVQSIFAKGHYKNKGNGNGTVNIQITHCAERALAVELLRFGEVLDGALRDYRPNFLTTYLFELANKYSVFFEQCPVLKAESEELRASRLELCALTARTLQKGLNLLGIETVERM
ncbi:MAG: arginine--tRNA ligase [Planctomycetaceae bacterium]|jgi:arginyl-tRNA synthetase|nr:arginine--tRNA ligase [Planctomycetaceae bacterium]